MLLELVQVEGSHTGTRIPSPIAQVILTQHFTSLLKACVAIVYGPETHDAQNEVRQKIDDLLTMVPSSQTMASLGSMMGQFSLPSLRLACSRLLSEQLLRPDGVRGLCGSILGESVSVNEESAPLVKLEKIARVLSSIPSSMKPEDYYRLVLPRLLSILQPQLTADGKLLSSAPDSHKRAVAFTISRMLSTNAELVPRVLGETLHTPFFPPSTPERPAQKALPALETLETLFTNVDPSSLVPTRLLGPIIAPLYALLAHLDKMRTGDPTLKELVRGLFRTWASTVDDGDAIDGWWTIVRSGAGWGDREGVSWHIVGDDVQLRIGETAQSSFTIQAATDVESLATGEGDARVFGFKPEPAHLVSLLKSAERKEVASALLVRALDEYQSLQMLDLDPLKTIFNLRLVMEMVDQLGSAAMTKPEHVLAFISHALRTSQENVRKGPKDGSKKGASKSGLASLRIVEEEDGESDSDDDAEDSDDEGPSDMLETALNLLLAVLEANPDITPINTPLLQVVLSDLEPLTLHHSEGIRSLSRETRLVLTARNASSSDVTTGVPIQSEDPKQKAQETYQQALKLLQDPILPVRAHGLVLLRKLIIPAKSNASDKEVDLDPALVPAILSIFLQCVQEDDSYIFLNAVQGLAAMVDKLGREILKGLVDVYAGGLSDGHGHNMTKAELDRRVRVGEALNQSIRRCGDALSIYVDILVPPLFQIVRSRDLPTTLRMSALGLLARCTETSAVSILPWWADLSAGLLELVQLEGVAIQSRTKKPNASEAGPSNDGVEGAARPKRKPEEEMDIKPLSVDPKMAPFRRSALHFLSMLLRSTVERLQDVQRAPVMTLDSGNIKLPGLGRRGLMDSEEYFSSDLLKRMRVVLGYARATDVDDVVRVMAREALELVNALEMARLGLT
ncbi:hypothetical protein FRB99_008705 [Tulasnella sp. 403]|nr:hypothetical protein FRB99_008705 [Tulasnella sp. 403]